MKKKIEDAIQELEDSYHSASMAVAEHLRTVASNGREYATMESMQCEAENLIEAAEGFLIRIGVRKKVKDALAVANLISEAEDLIKDLRRYVNDDNGGIPDWTGLAAALGRLK
jgi:hypothetical protein